ncbi:MAG: hypothetical protein Q9227_008233 [Pyrenula ochraceoflavens]
MSTSPQNDVQNNDASKLPEAKIELDVQKLHSLPSEQQDLFLLTFVSDLFRHVEHLDSNNLKEQQALIKQEVFKVLNLSSPSPTRVIRSTLGQILANIFRRGPRNLLYETINDLTNLINTGKGEKDLKTKHAAIVCLGDVWYAAGDSALSLAGVTSTSLLRSLKTARSYAGLRAAIFKALSSTISSLGSSLDESTARDIWKNARTAASSDQSVVTQRHACRCLETLVNCTGYFENPNDFEALRNTIFKAIDSPVIRLRHDAASCLAAILVKSYSEKGSKQAIPKVKKPKKVSKKPGAAAEDEEEEIERPGTPSRNATVHLTLNIPEMLWYLSAQYCRTSTSNKARAGIAMCYKRVALNLPSKVVEEHYSEIADHLFTKVLDHPTVTYNRYRLLLTRNLVKSILDDTIGQTILGENSRLNAARWLINDVLKNYPQVVQETKAPSKHALTAALSCLHSLISSLGSAFVLLAEICKQALFQVIQHPSYTVQIHVSHCLRMLVLACPQDLQICVDTCLRHLEKELEELSQPRPTQRRCAGYANGLAAVLGASRLLPLYGSVEIFSRVLGLATELLKKSSASELRVSATQIQVAWILIGGLMPLGPNFVKIHLNQLLLLWRNALPRPLGKENFAHRGTLEMNFLAHVRECALGSLLVFLEFNSSLVTTDGSKRIASMLQNSIMFLDSLPSTRSSEDVSNRVISALQLSDFAIMVRRRVLQCFAKLVSLDHLGHHETLTQSNLLSLSTVCFADPNSDIPKSLETSIASSASSFESLWELSDNWGGGVSGLVRGYEIGPMPGERQRKISSFRYLDAVDPVDKTLVSPICPAAEHDSVLLYSLHNLDDDFTTDGPATAVVNASIVLFAVAFPLQHPKLQESSLEQLMTLLASQSKQKDPAKKAAITFNITLALLLALVVGTKETQYASGNLSSPAVEKLFQDLLHRSIVDSDPYLRNISSEAIGRLCRIYGTQSTNAEVKLLIDKIVEIRSPDARAGCALALGSIHTQLGGMAAGFHVKTIVGVLLSLCNDSHPTVHFWSLEGLARVADSAGLTFSGYVTSTLGMLSQLYANETHNEEGQSLAASNAEAEYPTPLVIGRCVDSLINVLGPDLQDMSKPRDLIMNLIGFFGREEGEGMTMQSLVCLRHISIYAAKYMSFLEYVQRLANGLSAPNRVLQTASVEGLNDLMNRDAENVSYVAGNDFEEHLWLALDQDPTSSPLRGMVLNWLSQTGLSDTAMWVQRCQDILSKTKVKIEMERAPTTAKSETGPDLVDEEIAGFAAAAAAAQGEPEEKGTEGQEFLKWQTRVFAMTCLSELLSMVSREALPDQHIPAESALQTKIADIVRMAFSASTANVVELRVLGLRIIDQVLKLFGKTPDPDFIEASLLEQYQAQIGSALTPAFAADSTPELASEAINVCATFVTTGIVTTVERMGRIFKLLVSGLDSLANTGVDTTVGDLKGLSYNSRIMLKTSLLSAWAQLQISSGEQHYLEEIVQPHVAKLTPLWLSSLQEYARLKFEPEISSTLGSEGLSGDLNEVYAALNRQTLLKFYQDSWLRVLNAIANLVEKDSDFVFDALDGRLEDPESPTKVNGTVSAKDHISYRAEPVAFFFILFGLAYEALVVQSRDNAIESAEILQVLKKILRPSVSGNAIYQDTVFNESLETLGRMALTAGSGTQGVIVQICRNLSLDHVSVKADEDRNEKLSDDIEQLFELARVVVLVLVELVPTLGESAASQNRRSLNEEAITLSKLSLNALVDTVDVFPSIIRADLHACIVHTFCTILSTGTCQAHIVPQSFSIFKRFLNGLCRYPQSHEQHATSARLVRGCLRQFIQILKRAQRRDSEYSVPCAKNTLLAMTILVTNAGQLISPNDDLILAMLSDMTDCLQDLGLAKVAANCLRSLLASGWKNPTDEMVAKLLFPRLVWFVMDRSMEDPENCRGTVVQALTSSISTSPIDSRSTAIPVLVPALILRAKTEGKSLHQETASRLIELAAADQSTFRAVVGSMDDSQRPLLEEILRSGRGTQQQSVAEDREADAKPSIALRMDF